MLARQQRPTRIAVRHRAERPKEGLGQALIAGNLLPGISLDDVAIPAQYAVSRTSGREALCDSEARIWSWFAGIGRAWSRVLKGDWRTASRSWRNLRRFVPAGQLL